MSEVNEANAIFTKEVASLIRAEVPLHDLFSVVATVAHAFIKPGLPDIRLEPGNASHYPDPWGSSKTALDAVWAAIEAMRRLRLNLQNFDQCMVEQAKRHHPGRCD